MKKIEKEIKVTRYVAFDGTEFENESECLRYEGSVFGELIQQLPVVSYHTNDGFVGNDFTACYAIVPRTRHDIFVLGQIMGMVGRQDAVTGSDCDNLIVLQVSLNCNTLVDASIFRPAKWVDEISNGMFSVVSNIKQYSHESSSAKL